MSGKILPPWAMDRTRAREALADDLYFDGLERRVPCLTLPDHKNYICSRRDSNDYPEDLPVYHLRRLESDICSTPESRQLEHEAAASMEGVFCPVAVLTMEERIAAYKDAQQDIDFTTPLRRPQPFLTFEQHKAAKEALAKWDEWDRTRYDWRTAGWRKHAGSKANKRFEIKHGLGKPDLFI